jgi:hypothetical protein
METSSMSLTDAEYLASLQREVTYQLEKRRELMIECERLRKAAASALDELNRNSVTRNLPAATILRNAVPPGQEVDRR